MKNLINQILTCDNGVLDEEKGICVGYYYQGKTCCVIIKVNSKAVNHYKASQIIAVEKNPHLDN